MIRAAFLHSAGMVCIVYAYSSLVCDKSALSSPHPVMVEASALIQHEILLIRHYLVREIEYFVHKACVSSISEIIHLYFLPCA